LDLSYKELERTLKEVPRSRFKHVKCYGLHGTYDDGLVWVNSPAIRERPKALMSMGSSVGNFSKVDAAQWLRTFSAALQPGDSILIGIDGCRDPQKVFHAYNDEEGVTHDFVLNGLEHANRLLGSEHFDPKTWKVFGEYRYDSEGGRHVAFVSPRQDVVVDGITIKKDEKIQIEESNKYSPAETNRLLKGAGLQQGAKWANETGDYGKFRSCDACMSIFAFTVLVYHFSRPFQLIADSITYGF
jgi:EasF-like predicted methyltransferase